MHTPNKNAVIRRWWFPLALVLLAAIPRLMWLGELPGGLSGDEIFNAIDAGQIGWGNWPVFFSGNNGREPLFHYLVALSVQLFGSSAFTLRLPAALLGIGSVLLTYAIGERYHSRAVGMLAGVLIALSLWPIMHSRWVLRAVSLTFMSGLSAYWLLAGWQNGRWRDWLLAGLALGLTLYTYIPARYLPLAVGLWLAWLPLTNFARWRSQVPKMLAGATVTLLLSLPFLLYIWQNPGAVNQRSDGLTNTLDRALEGDVAPLVGSLGRMLQTFSLSGDEEWRYHLAEQPLFDPLASVGFYAGVLLSGWVLLRSLRRDNTAPAAPFWGLIWIWGGAMMAPNAILSGSPSFLRIAGSAIPLYLLASYGFMRLGNWLSERAPAAKAWLPVGYAAYGLVLGLVSWQQLSQTWHNRPEVREIYHVVLGEMGRYVAETLPPDERLFVAYDYVLDNTTPLTFAQYTDHPVSWFEKDGSLAVPAGDAGPLTYILPYNHTLPPEWLATLEMAGQPTVHTFQNGDPAFTTYRVAQPERLTLAPQQAQERRFIDGPLLLGWDAPARILQGELLPVTTYWEIPAEQRPLPNQLIFIQLTLRDGQHKPWGEASGLISFPQAGWEPDSRFYQQLWLPVAAGVPPGEMTIDVTLRDSDGALLPFEDGEQLAPPYRIVVQSRALVDFEPDPDMAIFDERLVLRDYQMSTLILPGLPLNFSLDWVALVGGLPRYGLQATLIDAQSGVVYAETAVADLNPNYPSTGWTRLEQVSTQLRINVPLDLPLGAEPVLQVTLEQAGERILPTIGENHQILLTIEQRPLVTEPPAVGVDLSAQDIRFGENVRLLGYTLEDTSSTAGQPLPLTLVWEVLDTPQRNWSIFTHLVGADGQLWGQIDGPPRGAEYMVTWRPGEIIVDERLVTIKPEAAGGRYTLRLGFYQTDDGTRLPVDTAAGPVGDFYELVEVELE